MKLIKKRLLVNSERFCTIGNPISRATELIISKKIYVIKNSLLQLLSKFS